MIYKKFGLANDNDMNVASGATALGVYWFFSDGFFCVVLERSISQINRANSDMDKRFMGDTLGAKAHAKKVTNQTG